MKMKTKAKALNWSGRQPARGSSESHEDKKKQSTRLVQENTRALKKCIGRFSMGKGQPRTKRAAHMLTLTLWLKLRERSNTKP